MHKNWSELKKPKSLQADKDTLTATYGKFTAEPFERGFGTTLGNALRRVLLSSLQGAAISSVRIKGVLHEFSTIPGVAEDVTDIILNLKGVLIKLDGDGARNVRIVKKGAGVVKAGDIATDSHVRILNPEHHIATCGKEAPKPNGSSFRRAAISRLSSILGATRLKALVIEALAAGRVRQ